MSVADLEAIVARVAPHLPRDTVDMIFAQVDTDRDGRVSYGDFHAMMVARPNGRCAAASQQHPGARTTARQSECAAMMGGGPAAEYLATGRYSY